MLQSFSRISNEEGVREALNSNVFRLLNSILPGELIDRHSALPTVWGEPDFVLITKEEDMMNSVLRLAIEVKTKWVLSSNDLVAQFNREVETQKKNRKRKRNSVIYNSNLQNSVIRQIRQIFGYLCHNGLRYGVITTYDYSWFLCRSFEGPKLLLISPAISYDSRNPTILQCFFHLASLARNDKHRALSPDTYFSTDHGNLTSGYDNNYQSDIGQRGRGGPSHQNTEKRELRRSRRNAGKDVEEPRNIKSSAKTEVQRFGWNAFHVMGVLGGGRSGKVFKATFQQEEVALKICDIWQHPEYEAEMLNEVAVYKHLERLQGRSIPKFKGAGYTSGGLFALMTEMSGIPIDIENLSDFERHKVVKTLCNIHNEGVIHNDIKLDNILVRRHGNICHVMMIDFALSERSADMKRARNEMVRLKRMLGV